MSEKTEETISIAKGFSKKVSKVLDELKRTGKIKEVNGGQIKGAQWDATTKTLIIGPDATPANIWHELVHYYQCDCNSCLHAGREWQAYLLEEIMSCVDRFYEMATNKPYLGLTSDIMGILYRYCSRQIQDDVPYMDESVYNYIISINYEAYVQIFMDYWREVDQRENPLNPQYKKYYDGYDPDYDWDWNGLLEKLGIEVNKE